MDTAQKLLKTTGLLLAIALLMVAPGWAQTTLLAPSSVSIGSTGFNTASVTSSASPTTEITYGIGTPNVGSDPNWLTVTGGTTTPASLTFRANAAGLSSGPHTATVILTPIAPTGVAAVTISVTFDGSGGGGGGGGSNILTATPGGAVNLSAALNSQASANVTINTSSTTPITITPAATVTSGGVNWLSISSISTNTISNVNGSILTITASGIGLSSGVTYQGTVTVTPSTGTSLAITVNFTVGTGGSNGTWSVSQSSVPLSFTTSSGNFPTSSVTVNTTGTSLTYNLATTSSNGWLVLLGEVTTATGIGVGQPFILKVGSNGNILSTGQYSGQVIIYDSDNLEQLRVTVVLTVNGGNSTGLTISPGSILSFNAALNSGEQSQVVSLNSSVGGLVTVTGSVPAWLRSTGPSPSSVVAGQASTFTVFANPFGLVAGTYSGSIAVAVGAQSGTLTVNLVVGGGGTGTGTTAVAPTALAFAYQAGTPVNFVAQQKLVVTGPSGPWSSVISNSTPWLK